MVETAAGTIPCKLDGSGSETVLVLGHGAGAGMDHPFMATVAEMLSDEVDVVRFNFHYVQAGKKAPDRQPVLEQTYRDVVDHVRSELGPRRLILGGKSMGGRIASHIAASGVACEGLVFLGYPLHPPGRPERLRDSHLYEVTAPMLFVEGTRDPFCPLETLERVRAKLTSPNDLVVIDDGDHSFRVRKSSGRSNTDALLELVEEVKAWIRRLG